MAGNKGIIFGNYFMDYEMFKPIFIEWYSQKRESFKKALEEKVIAEIEQMVKIENGKVVNRHGMAVRTVEYNARKIYLAWETISKDYFGNGSVSLLIGAKFGKNNYQWSQVVEENTIIDEKGIQVRKKALDKIQDAVDQSKGIYAAAQIQDIINKHINDMMKQLDTKMLDKPEARLMHQLLEARHSSLNNANFHFTGATYNQIIFGKQQNAAGKQLDAFMNHMGNLHNQVFNLLSTPTVSGNSLANSLGSLQDIEDDFPMLFNNPYEVQPWLLDSLNSASWLTGGDIVVTDNKGKVIYNIQLKTTSKGKTFGVATSVLYSFATQMRDLINEDSSPEELAEIMFKKLSTSTANIAPTIEQMATENIYADIEKQLGLNKGSLKIPIKIKI